MQEDDFLIAVGEAAQDAVWKTQHPLTQHLAEDDPLRVQYLREYQMSVGRQVLAAIEHLLRASSCHERPRGCPPAWILRLVRAIVPGLGEPSFR